MQVGDAIKLAKDWVRDIYADEQISNLGLEEVKFSESQSEWKVTVGFSRPWDNKKLPLATIGASMNRSLKVVTINDIDQSVKSVENRETHP